MILKIYVNISKQIILQGEGLPPASPISVFGY